MVCRFSLRRDSHAAVWLAVHPDLQLRLFSQRGDELREGSDRGVGHMCANNRFCDDDNGTRRHSCRDDFDASDHDDDGTRHYSSRDDFDATDSDDDGQWYSDFDVTTTAEHACVVARDCRAGKLVRLTEWSLVLPENSSARPGGIPRAVAEYRGGPGIPNSVGSTIEQRRCDHFVVRLGR